MESYRSKEATDLTEAQLRKVRTDKTASTNLTKTAEDAEITEKQLHDGKKDNEVDEITQLQLEEVRSDKEPEETVEVQLNKVRKEAQATLVEEQLNSSKSKLVKHRNEEASLGNINKLEEQRLKGKTAEKEEYKSAAAEDKDSQYWKIKSSPDGLKLAQKKTK